MSANTDTTLDRKHWVSLAARAALRGMQLWRSDPDDGPQRYFIGRYGMVQVLPDADVVNRLLDAREERAA